MSYITRLSFKPETRKSVHVLLLPPHPQETKIHSRQRHKTFVLENRIRAGALLMVFKDHPLPRKFMTPDTPRGRPTARNYPLLGRTETGSLRRGRLTLHAGEGVSANLPAARPGFGFPAFVSFRCSTSPLVFGHIGLARMILRA